MIITKTPFRFSIFGGGCDYPIWYNRNDSFVLTSAIDLYCYLIVRELGSFFLDHKSAASYSIIEKVSDNKQFKHPSIRECLKFLGFLEKRVSITHVGDLPARSGIGSSSSFTVGLLKALLNLKKQNISNNKLAHMACHVEQNLIGESVGVQDQFAASYGGLIELSLNKKSIKAKKLNLSKEFIKQFENYIMLGFTGLIRNSNDYSSKLTKKIDENELDSYLKEMNQISLLGIEAFKKEEDISEIAKLIDRIWSLKTRLDKKSTFDVFQDAYDIAKKNGAIGGKLMGAGGGGFFYLIADPKFHEKIKKSLHSIEVWVPFKFASNGSRILHNSLMVQK